MAAWGIVGASASLNAFARKANDSLDFTAPGRCAGTQFLGGASTIFALVTLLLLIVVVLVLLVVVLGGDKPPAKEGAPASQPSINAAPEAAPTETKEDIDKPTTVMPPANQ